MSRRTRRRQAPRRPRSRGFLSDMDFDFSEMDLSLDSMFVPAPLKPYINDATFSTLLITGALAAAGAVVQQTRSSR